MIVVIPHTGIVLLVVATTILILVVVFARILSEFLVLVWIHFIIASPICIHFPALITFLSLIVLLVVVSLWVVFTLKVDIPVIETPLCRLVLGLLVVGGVFGIFLIVSAHHISRSLFGEHPDGCGK